MDDSNRENEAPVQPHSYDPSHPSYDPNSGSWQSNTGHNSYTPQQAQVFQTHLSNFIIINHLHHNFRYLQLKPFKAARLLWTNHVNQNIISMVTPKMGCLPRCHPRAYQDRLHPFPIPYILPYLPIYQPSRFTPQWWDTKLLIQLLVQWSPIHQWASQWVCIMGATIIPQWFHHQVTIHPHRHRGRQMFTYQKVFLAYHLYQRLVSRHCPPTIPFITVALL